MLKAVIRYELHQLAGQICQINARSLLGGEKQSDRRKAKTQELNRAARSAPTESRRPNRALIVWGRHPRVLLSVAPTPTWFTVLPLSKTMENTFYCRDHFKDKLRCDSIRPLNCTNTLLKMTSEYIRCIKILKMRPHKHTQNPTEGHRSQEAASDRWITQEWKCMIDVGLFISTPLKGLF